MIKLLLIPALVLCISASSFAQDNADLFTLNEAIEKVETAQKQHDTLDMKRWSKVAIKHSIARNGKRDITTLRLYMILTKTHIDRRELEDAQSRLTRLKKYINSSNHKKALSPELELLFARYHLLKGNISVAEKHLFNHINLIKKSQRGETPRVAQAHINAGLEISKIYSGSKYRLIVQKHYDAAKNMLNLWMVNTPDTEYFNLHLASGLNLANGGKWSQALEALKRSLDYIKNGSPSVNNKLQLYLSLAFVSEKLGDIHSIQNYIDKAESLSFTSDATYPRQPLVRIQERLTAVTSLRGTLHATVTMDIDEYGRVVDERILQSSNTSAERAAIQSLDSFLYQPRIENGKAVVSKNARYRFTWKGR